MSKKTVKNERIFQNNTQLRPPLCALDLWFDLTPEQQAFIIERKRRVENFNDTRYNYVKFGVDVTLVIAKVAEQINPAAFEALRNLSLGLEYSSPIIMDWFNIYCRTFYNMVPVRVRRTHFLCGVWKIVRELFGDKNKLLTIA